MHLLGTASVLTVENWADAVKGHSVFVTDQITDPHFTTNSKKTIMVLFSGVTQDHWDLRALVRTKTRGRVKLELQVPLSCMSPATDTEQHGRLYFSCKTSRRFLSLGLNIHGSLPVFSYQALLWGRCRRVNHQLGRAIWGRYHGYCQAGSCCDSLLLVSFSNWTL